jgi:hypothetical protein
MRRAKSLRNLNAFVIEPPRRKANNLYLQRVRWKSSLSKKRGSNKLLKFWSIELSRRLRFKISFNLSKKKLRWMKE